MTKAELIATEAQEAGWKLYELIKATGRNDAPSSGTLAEWQALAIKAAGMARCDDCGDDAAIADLTDGLCDSCGPVSREDRAGALADIRRDEALDND